MTGRLLTKQELKKLYDEELKGTFPPEELKPFRDIEELLDRGLYEPLGFFEGDCLLAYALLWAAPGVRYVLLDYLGVTSARRGGGVGSAVLVALKEHMTGRWDGILAEVEAPDPASPELEQQHRRIRFYERGGFSYAGYDTGLFGVHYRMYACGKQDETLQREAQEGIYRTKFSPELYRRVVQLPLLPGETCYPEENRSEMR